jgi:hypothetical protein
MIVPCPTTQGQKVQLEGRLRATIYDFAAPKQSLVEFYKEVSLAPNSELQCRHLYGSAPLAKIKCRYPIYIRSYIVRLVLFWLLMLLLLLLLLLLF